METSSSSEQVSASAKRWISRLKAVAPEAGPIVITRLAWKLAANGIHTDEDLARVTTEQMLTWPSFGSKSIEYRNLYLRRASRTRPAPDVADFDVGGIIR